ncbi:unnamed protein product [Sphacelaria rigidula]
MTLLLIGATSWKGYSSAQLKRQVYDYGNRFGEYDRKMETGKSYLAGNSSALSWNGGAKDRLQSSMFTSSCCVMWYMISSREECGDGISEKVALYRWYRTFQS